MDPTPFYRSPLFLTLLGTFITAFAKIATITAPQLAKEINQVGVPDIVDLISAGLGLVIVTGTGIALWIRGRSKVAPLTLTQKSADAKIAATAAPPPQQDPPK